jgi:hypothetical protein
LPFNFKVRNSSFLPLYDTQVVMKLGPMSFGSPDLTQPLRPVRKGPCESLRSYLWPQDDSFVNVRTYSDFVAASKDEVSLSAKAYGTLRHNAEVTFPTQSRGSGLRAVVGVGVSWYRVEAFGVRRWRVFSCREFQTWQDAEGRTHFIPFP